MLRQKEKDCLKDMSELLRVTTNSLVVAITYIIFNIVTMSLSRWVTTISTSSLMIYGYGTKYMVFCHYSSYLNHCDLAFYSNYVKEIY